MDEVTQMKLDLWKIIDGKVKYEWAIERNSN